MRYRIAISVFAFLVTICLLTSQRGGLGFFSVQSLRYRVQSERTIFALGIPFYRSSYQSVDNELIALLVREGYVTPSSEPEDWVCVFHWNDSWRDGDGYLYHILNRDRRELIEWTKTHPDCAILVWSEGFRCLRSKDRKMRELGRQFLWFAGKVDDLDELKAILADLQTKLQ